MATSPVAITDGLGVHDAFGPSITVTALADTAQLHDSVILFKGVALSIAARMSIGHGEVIRMARAASVRSTLRLRGSSVVNATYRRSIATGSLHLRDLFGFQHALIIEQALRFGSHARVTLGLTMAEALRMTQSQARTLILSAMVAHGLDLHDVLRSGHGAALADAVALADRMTRIYCAVAEADEALALDDAVDLTLQVVVVLSDALDLDDAEVVRSIFAGRLIDGLDFTLGVAEPDGGITTWAMNTRTGAVTEYTNFAFTSFAPFGNSFLATGRDGLYELRANDDAGDPIIADMISGLAQMTGSQLGSFKAAYIAMRGEGQFFLRLVADEGRATTYRVTARSLRTARVDMGKGWRARYFSFQLVSTGQDFDLDELTFLPIASTRRI